LNSKDFKDDFNTPGKLISLAIEIDIVAGKFVTFVHFTFTIIRYRQ
jgi:hypothetical protein